MKKEKRRPEDLVPNPWNPNRMSLRQMEKLVKRIAESDPELEKQPIVARPLPDGGLQIVDGEHRWMAAKEGGAKRVSVHVVEMSEIDAKLETLGFNMLRGSPDIPDLSSLAADLNGSVGIEPILDVTALIEDELEELLRMSGLKEAESEGGENVPEIEPEEPPERTEVLCVSLTPEEKRRVGRVLKACEGSTPADRFITAMDIVEEAE